MSEPVYKLFIVKRFTDAWHQLSKEEQDTFVAKTQASEAALGREFVLTCDSRWANEDTAWWGVVKYPNVEAAQQFVAQNEDHWRYIESKSILGTKMPDEEA